MIIRVLGFLLAGLLASAAHAQTWQPALNDNGGYAYGTARAEGLPMAFVCTVRSAQNLPLIDVGAHEDEPTAPYAMRIEFFGDVIPFNLGTVRTDLVLWLDDTGYKLPAVQHDEFYGYWRVELSMGDAIYRALGSASRVVLAVGNQAAWDIPVSGLGTAIAQAQQHCAATLVATGNPAPAWFGSVNGGASQPAAAAAAFTLPQQVITHANRLCQGRATIAPEAIQAGDMDGDGAPDVLLDWNHVRCAPPAMARSFCGAANCSVDVFMSSRGYTTSEGDGLLGTVPSMQVLPSGQVGIYLGGSFSMCGQNGELCARPWVWNGQTLVRQ